MSIPTYDPGLVILSFGEVQLFGYMEGTFITVERAENGYEVVSGSDGTPARVRNRNKIGSVTAHLQQTSPSNILLSNLALADDPEIDGVPPAGVRPLLLRELGGTTIASATEAWIRKMPNIERAKEFMGVEWVFDCAPLRHFVGAYGIPEIGIGF